MKALAERVEHAGRGARAAARVSGSSSLPAAAVQRRLHRARRRGQRLGDLLERKIEHVLEHDGHALLGREPHEQRARGLARLARIRLPGGWSPRRRARLRLERRAARAVDPEVRGDPEQPGARTRAARGTSSRASRSRASSASCTRSSASQGAAGEVAAIAVELRPQRLEGVEKALPRRLHVLAQVGEAVAAGRSRRDRLIAQHGHVSAELRGPGQPQLAPSRDPLRTTACPSPSSTGCDDQPVLVDQPQPGQRRHQPRPRPGDDRLARLAA